MARHGVLLVNPQPADRRNAFAGSVPALQPVANRPLVCHALQAMHDAAIDEITVAVPTAAAEDVHACIRSEFADVRVAYVRFDTPRDTGRALREAADGMDDAPCVVHVADGLLAQPLAPLATPPWDEDADMLLLMHRSASRAEQLGETARRLLRIAEFDPSRSALGVAGVCMFGLGALRRACSGAELVGGPGDFITMADGLATAGGSMAAQLVRGWRHYAGEVDDLLELNRTTLELLTEDADHSHGDGSNRIEGRVSIDPTAEVTASAIVGPVIIGPRAVVTSAYVGPYTSIGAGARIEGAEIEQSIIGADASVRYIDGRLALSVIGPRARVHREFSVPRVLRLRVGAGDEVLLP